MALVLFSFLPHRHLACVPIIIFFVPVSGTSTATFVPHLEYLDAKRAEKSDDICKGSACSLQKIVSSTLCHVVIF